MITPIQELGVMEWAVTPSYKNERTQKSQTEKLYGLIAKMLYLINVRGVQRL